VIVVLVHGPPRSGTTLVGRAIGASTGLAFIGEVERAWDWRAEGRHCGCGLELGTCNTWTDAPLGRTTHEWLKRRRSVLDLARAVLVGRPTDGARAYARDLEDLYQHLANKLDSPGLVDTSKYLRSLVATCLVDDIELVVVHLVRDPRGALHSRSRVRRERIEARVHARPTLARRPGLLAGLDALTWLMRLMHTWAGPVLARRTHATQLRLSYESFCADPDAAIGAIASMLDLSATDVVNPLCEIHLPEAHSAGGNAHRFASGPVRIREDTSWRNESGGIDRALAAGTWLAYRGASKVATGYGALRRRVVSAIATVRP